MTNQTTDGRVERAAARRRALRAARVVAFGALAAMTACGSETTTPGADSGPSEVADASMLDAASTAIDAASGNDAGVITSDDAGERADAFVASDDAAVESDAGCPDVPRDATCCEIVGGYWDEASMTCAIAVPGPFVPPTMVG